MTYPVLLAQQDNNLDLFEFLRKPGSAWVEVFVVLGIIMVVVLFVFIWAAFWRTPRKRRHIYSHQPAADGSTAGLPRRRKRKPKWLRLLRRHRRNRRRRRRRSRQANPTLAQIGGLPPQRREPPTDP